MIDFATSLGTAAPGSSESAPSVAEYASLFPELEIESFLGRGGMGRVYRARILASGQLAALKLLKADQIDPELSERFTREARAMMDLEHPNIVELYDFGQRNGWLYILMELVDGCSLAERLRLGRLERDEVLEILKPICSALQYAHDEGVVHRDIKPGNILLSEDGQMKLADFGLAKISEQPEDYFSLTTVSSSFGTPLYMAPEQRRDSGTVDPRSDIYSLGVVAYQMCTGEVPAGRFPPPSSTGVANQNMDEAIMKALESDPSQRWSSVREFRARLSHPRSWPRWIATKVGAVILVAAIVGTIFYPQWRKHRGPGPTPPATAPANAESRPAPPPELSSERLLLGATEQLHPDPAPPGSHFGQQIAWHQGDLAISATGSRPTPLHRGSGPGAVVSFQREPGSVAWKSRAILVHPHGHDGDQFGAALALHSNTLAIGAPDLKRDDGKGEVLVYERSNRNEPWTLSHTLAEPSQARQRFGAAVALDGDTLAIASYQLVATDEHRTTLSIYRRTESGWTKEASFPDERRGDISVGDSLAMHGDTIVLGRHRDVDGGSAETFMRRGATWERTSVLVSPDRNSNQMFGQCVDIEGDLIVVGARQARTTDKNIHGAVYLFRRRENPALWHFQECLLPDDPDRRQFFGTNLDLHEGALAVAVGIHPSGTAGHKRAAAYLFKLQPWGWEQIACYRPAPSLGLQNTSHGLAVSLNHLIIGLPHAETGSSQTGAAFVVPHRQRRK